MRQNIELNKLNYSKQLRFSLHLMNLLEILFAELKVYSNIQVSSCFCNFDIALCCRMSSFILVEVKRSAFALALSLSSNKHWVSASERLSSIAHCINSSKQPALNHLIKWFRVVLFAHRLTQSGYIRIAYLLR